MTYRLLVLSPSAYPLGGVADWLDYLLSGLEALGHEVTLGLVAGDLHRPEPYLDRHPWRRVVRIGNPTGSRVGRIEAMKHAIRRSRSDLLLVVNQVAVYEALWHLRREGTPTPKVAMTLHGLQEEFFGDVAGFKPVLDAVVATNRLACALVRDALDEDARVFYAPYGVPPVARDPKADAPDNDIIRLLYAGRVAQEQKRVLDLPPILEQLQHKGIGVRLSVAGGGAETESLKQGFAACGVDGLVDFLGTLTPEELAQAYRDHDALIITSDWETGPIVAWEAMSHDLAVVTSRYLGCGAEGALVDDENSLLFPVGDIEAAADAVARLAQPGVRERLVQGGRKLVETRYTRNRSVEQWDQVIGQIMALPALASPAGPPADFTSEGRLDRWLGPVRGELVRRALGIRFRHTDAGGEWPHSAHGAGDRASFLRAAMRREEGHE